ADFQPSSDLPSNSSFQPALPFSWPGLGPAKPRPRITAARKRESLWNRAMRLPPIVIPRLFGNASLRRTNNSLGSEESAHRALLLRSATTFPDETGIPHGEASCQPSTFLLPQ